MLRLRPMCSRGSAAQLQDLSVSLEREAAEKEALRAELARRPSSSAALSSAPTAARTEPLPPWEVPGALHDPRGEAELRTALTENTRQSRLLQAKPSQAKPAVARVKARLHRAVWAGLRESTALAWLLG